MSSCARAARSAAGRVAAAAVMAAVSARSWVGFGAGVFRPRMVYACAR